MATSLDNRLEIPSRLRLTRQNYSFAATVADNTHTEQDSTDDSENDRNAPRYGLSRISIDSLDGPLDFSAHAQAQSTPAPSSDAARRLREVMARAQGSNTPTSRAIVQRPRTPSGSILESDMDMDDQDTPIAGQRHQVTTPFSSNNQPPSPAQSEARKTLRDLFSRALRDAGDTPERPRLMRRGSMDSSISEKSPVKTSSRVDFKMNRIGFSDDEAERETLSRSEASEASTEKSPPNSRAAAFNSLRERIERPNLASSSGSTISYSSSVDMDATPKPDPNHGKRFYGSNNVAGPSQRSISQFPSQFLGSNLMNDNTEMRKLLMEAQGETTDSDVLEKQEDSESEEITAKPFPVRSNLKELIERNNKLTWRRASETDDSDDARTKKSHEDEANAKNNHGSQKNWNRPLSSYMNRRRSRVSDLSDVDEGYAHDPKKNPSLRDQGRHISQASTSKQNAPNGSTSSEDTQRPEKYNKTNPTTTQEAAPSVSSSQASSDTENTNDTEGDQGRQPTWNTFRPKWNRDRSSRLIMGRRQLPVTREQEVHRDLQNSDEQGSLDRDHLALAEYASKRNETLSRSPRESASYINGRSIPNDGSRSALLVRNISSSKEQESQSASSYQNVARGSPRARRLQREPSPSSEVAVEVVDLQNEKTPKATRVLPYEASAIAPQSTTADRQQKGVSRIKIRLKAANDSKPSLPPEGKTSKTPESAQQSLVNPTKLSMASEALNLHDSDIESFQEEDIAASSSAPRVYNIDTQSNADEDVSQIDLSKVRLSSQRHQKKHTTDGGAPVNLPANFSPPPSPPNHSLTSDSVITTPKRHAAINSSKLEFKTPSPPKGMPALPDPPSSDEAVDNDRIQPLSSHIPATPRNKTDYEDMKTPRPPGAWATPFATPAPAPRIQSRGQDLDSKNNTMLQNDVYTPPASYSRATSMIMKTPAPPGAWLPTPAPATLKRLQQKVRFDDNDVTVSAGQHVHEDSSLTSNDPTVDGSVLMKAAGKKRLPRTPGRLRVLDAFGNEIKSSESERRHHAIVTKQVSQKKAEPDDSSKKTQLRMPDPTEKEIIEPKEEVAVMTSTPEEVITPSKHTDEEDVTALIEEIKIKHLERNRALELLKENIAWLRNAFGKNDDLFSQKPAGDLEPQLTILQEQSIRARENQEQLLKRIKELEDIDQQLGLLSTKNSQGRVRHDNVVGYGWSFLKVFAILIFLQGLFLLLSYKLFSLGARQMFLTTYIDPFYPELNLHVTDPGLLRCSTSYSCISRTLPRLKWAEPMVSLLRVCLDSFFVIRDTMWGSPPQSSVWPPT